MQAKVDWKGDLAFEGRADTGFTIDLDAESEVGGNDAGFRPIELMAVSLAGCTAMDVISILKKKRQDVTGFEVRVDADRADDHPKVITNAAIDYLVAGHQIDEKAVQRAIQLSAERYCPVQAMLSQVFPIVLRYQVFEGDSIGENLTAEGLVIFPEK